VRSPATVKHRLVRMRLAKLLHTFVVLRKLGTVLEEKALIALTRNDYEPDINVFGRGKAALVKPDQLILPPPDFPTASGLLALAWIPEFVEGLRQPQFASPVLAPMASIDQPHQVLLVSWVRRRQPDDLVFRSE
jgi:hypothetical protein